jgi:4-hydroxybenzoate polyprenyltransferase
MSDASRSLNAWRRAGYRLLPGDTFSYILHLRPAEWPIMAAHTALGWVLAVGLMPAAHGDRLGVALWSLLLWVVFLNGGTLAINSVYDDDDGDIGYLNAPPKPPKHLLAFSLALMGVGQLLAFTLPRGFTWAYAACFAMSIAYSVPPLRLKAVGGVDWIINMIGFGTLTPYAGWAATGRPVDTPGALVLLGFCPLFAALYPLTQLYQWDEDLARGDRTLVIMLGRGPSLMVAIAATLVAFGFFAFAAYLGFARWWQWLAIGVALLVWLAILVPWQRAAETRTAKQDQRGFYAALGAWAVTDVAIVLAFGL